MIPKWKTEKKFMLRMARRRGRLPEQEHLISGDPDACLEYSKILKSRLPVSLESTLIEGLRQKDSRQILDWIIEYTKVSGSRTSQELEDLFIEKSVKNAQSPYDFGARRILNYCKACDGNISSGLEELMWRSENCSFQYAMNYNKRIPDQYEKTTLAQVDDDDLFEYAQKFFGKELPPDIEELFIERPNASYLYAKNVIKGKLSDSIHSALIMKTYASDSDYKVSVGHYLDFVEEVNVHVANVLSTFDPNTKVGDVLKTLLKSPN